ncbi:hypothetical protein CHLRE_09g412676v5 [Chlamydomonas reinhardtii]|uniref:Uncharacterized protein n=1 Tax=Chlamydomonas reinhardtii TaxID=3055 RepID=A0A2K3DFQ4_CHLRE|nr:uncharacterized protein CHLRE_09g412676v5 [Chlamydomonas reinhardtii]PNW79371.1 hypothetical protein CHLRE_09g412676v5 [Chlamydomonas reinhardtii]
MADAARPRQSVTAALRALAACVYCPSTSATASAVANHFPLAGSRGAGGGASGDSKRSIRRRSGGA